MTPSVHRREHTSRCGHTALISSSYCGAMRRGMSISYAMRAYMCFIVQRAVNIDMSVISYNLNCAYIRTRKLLTNSLDRHDIHETRCNCLRFAIPPTQVLKSLGRKVTRLERQAHANPIPLETQTKEAPKSTNPEPPNKVKQEQQSCKE